MHFFATLITLALAAVHAYANCVGSGSITTNIYTQSPNPPSCGTPYSQLDISRITAVQQLDKAVDCGTCLKVISTANPSNFVYVLAVDTGGQGLDLSQPSFEQLFGDDTGRYPASWAPTDPSYCADIYLGSLPESTLPGLNALGYRPPYTSSQSSSSSSSQSSSSSSSSSSSYGANNYAAYNSYPGMSRLIRRQDNSATNPAVTTVPAFTDLSSQSAEVLQPLTPGQSGAAQSVPDFYNGSPSQMAVASAKFRSTSTVQSFSGNASASTVASGGESLMLTRSIVGVISSVILALYVLLG